MSTIDAKRIARDNGRMYATGRWIGRAKNGKGRLFPSGGVLFVATQFGIDEVKEFEREARRTWNDLHTLL